jgi:tetratricopeptide (TPR) repeat protein
MKFTKIFWGAVLVCFLWQWALGQKPEKPRLPLGAYKTTAKIDLTSETTYDSAIVILNEAISFYPNDAELHFLLGKAYYYKNRPKEMGQQFAQAESLKIQPKFQEEIQKMKAEKWLQVFNQGAKAFNEQKQDTALEKFTICTILDPQDYRGFMDVGRVYSLKGENDKAISYLKEGLKLAPDTLDLLRLYAVALHNTGKTEEALEVYLKIIKKDPTDASALNNIVSIYVLKKDLDKALLFCQKMIDVDSSFKDAYFNMGWIYVQQIQEVNRALDSLKDATGAYRTDEKSKVRKEELEKKRVELFTQAETRLRKTVELDSSDIDAQLLLAQAYLDQDKLDQALGSLESLAQKDSTNCEVLVKLAAVYAKKGMAKAKETWQKAQDCSKKQPK